MSLKILKRTVKADATAEEAHAAVEGAASGDPLVNQLLAGVGDGVMRGVALRDVALIHEVLMGEVQKDEATERAQKTTEAGKRNLSRKALKKAAARVKKKPWA